MSLNSQENGSGLGPAVHKGMGYFPAVDGLRAVAVTSVVLFHLHASLLPSGYVGVDIFFVISGFVVTASLAHLQFDRIRDLLAYFYARRLVRIMPALVACLMTFVTLYTVLIPHSWMSNVTERSATAAFLGLSNMVLARSNDSYFAPTSDLNPFLHTWSLGVEEQFYLIFPFLLFFHARTRHSKAFEKISLAAIVGLGLLSFILSGLLAWYNPKFAFYLLPSRFWELALGMTLALGYPWWRWRLAKASNGLVQGAGVLALLLLIGAFNLPAGASFPFPYALLPALAAALTVMLVCAREAFWGTRLLSSAPMLWIGRRSYSIYLWHWPIFVMLRWTTGLESVALQIGALIAAFLFGHLSYHLIEGPTRNASHRTSLSRGRVALIGAGVTGIAALLGFLIIDAQPKLSVSVTAKGDSWFSDDKSPLIASPAGCRLHQDRKSMGGGSVKIWSRIGCGAPNPSGRLFVIGNSHALAYTPMLRQFALDTGHETRLYFKSQCAYLGLLKPMDAQVGCKPFHKSAEAAFLAELRPGDILFMPSMRLNQDGSGFGKDNWSKIHAAVPEAQEKLPQLAATGARLIFEAPKPVIPSPLFRCTDWYMRGNPICKDGFAMPRSDMLALRAPMMATIKGLGAGNPAVGIWDPFDALCPGEGCESFDRGEPIFFDRHHLSAHGNQMLRQKFDGDFSALFAEPALVRSAS